MRHNYTGSLFYCCVYNFFQTTLDALRDAKNERLWFKTMTKLGKLYFDREDYAKLSRILKQLHTSCMTQEGEDDLKKGTQLLEIYALEIQVSLSKIVFSLSLNLWIGSIKVLWWNILKVSIEISSCNCEYVVWLEVSLSIRLAPTMSVPSRTSVAISRVSFSYRWPLAPTEPVPCATFVPDFRCTPHRRTTKSWKLCTTRACTSSLPFPIPLSWESFESVGEKCTSGKWSSRKLTQTSSRRLRQDWILCNHQFMLFFWFSNYSNFCCQSFTDKKRSAIA